jgi:hypothetical protein
MRWFLIFTTPINRFWNMLAWDVPRDIRNRRVGHALVTLAALFSIAAIEEIIRTWRVPDEPEEGIARRATCLAASAVSLIFSVSDSSAND